MLFYPTYYKYQPNRDRPQLVNQAFNEKPGLSPILVRVDSGVSPQYTKNGGYALQSGSSQTLKITLLEVAKVPKADISNT